MPDTYFESTLSKCRSIVIKDVCSHYSTRNKLMKSVSEEWGGYSRIDKDYELIDAVDALFKHGELSHFSDFVGDSRIIYSRCRRFISTVREKRLNGESLDYNHLFDGLVNLCWLLSSVYNCKQRFNNSVCLLRDPGQIRESIKTYLDDTRKIAIDEHNETIYITEGINAKKEHPWFPALYDNKYPRSAYYIQSGWTTQDLEDRKRNLKRECSLNLALYYGLTATSALAYNYERGLI